MSVGLNLLNLKRIDSIVSKGVHWWDYMAVGVRRMDRLEEDGKVREGTVEVNKGTAWEEGIERDWIVGRDSYCYFIEGNFDHYLFNVSHCLDEINFVDKNVWIGNWLFSFSFLNVDSKGFSNPWWVLLFTINKKRVIDWLSISKRRYCFYTKY